MSGSEKAFVLDFPLFAYMFLTLSLSDVIIQGSWPEVYQNWLIFIDYYCTVIILKQRTKMNSNVIQLKLW